MAFDKTPTAWITSYSSNGTNLTLPISSYSDLSVAEANTTTGDIRQIYYAFCQQMYNAYLGKAGGNQPIKMFINKNISTDASTNKSTVTFTCNFICDTAAMDVTSEV